MKYDSISAMERSRYGRTAYGFDTVQDGTATVYEFRDGAVHRDIGDVASPAQVGGVDARFTTEQMATAFCAGLENALPVIELATDEATHAIAQALEHGGVEALDVLRETRGAAVASGRQ